MDREAVRVRRGAWAGAALLAAGFLSLASCQIFAPRSDPGGVAGGVDTISGRLVQGIECLILDAEGKSYELTSWPATVPIPPLDAHVTLRVRAKEGVSFCMVGPMVEVLQVLRVRTDFRTQPVTGHEIWTPRHGPIVLGRVEVTPGASLTILPGTQIRITTHGALEVRGLLTMVGTAAESIRVTGGGVVLDSAEAGTRIAFASLSSISVLSGAQDLHDLRARYLMAANGSRVRIRGSSLGSVETFNSNVAVESSAIERVVGIYAGFAITGSTLGRLDLSYSSAQVRGCVFGGARAYLVFHGPSGGTFESNRFVADETEIEVRHDANPEFHENAFLGASMRVRCESYQGTTCIRMERNWWGTAVESEIQGRIEAGCPVCYSPWLTAPPGPLAARAR